MPRLSLVATPMQAFLLYTESGNPTFLRGLSPDQRAVFEGGSRCTSSMRIGSIHHPVPDLLLECRPDVNSRLSARLLPAESRLGARHRPDTIGMKQSVVCVMSESWEFPGAVEERLVSSLCYSLESSLLCLALCPTVLQNDMYP